MSKKLIAVASAAALALSALAGVAPASASLTSVSYKVFADSTASTSATSATAPLEVRVPWNNLLAQANSDATTRASLNTAIKVDITVAAGATASVTTAGGVKVLDALTNNSTNKYRATTSGKDSWSYTNTTSSSTTQSVYLYTTVTTVGTFVVNNAGATATYHLKGLVGPDYNVSVKFPTVIGAGATASIDATVTDVFGNAVTDTTAAAFAGTMTVSKLGAATVVGGGTFTWNTTRSVYEAKVTGDADGGNVALSVALTTSTQVANGLPAPKDAAFASIVATDLSGTVATLNAQVAALTAQLAASRPKATSVTKKRFNTLARKWNAANPTDRVALKK